MVSPYNDREGFAKPGTADATSTAKADGDSAIDLSWTAPADSGASAITGYQIESSRAGNTWGDLVANTGSTATTYRHGGLQPGTTRHYRVSAINSAGAGLPSNVDDATTGGRPGAPTSLTAAADADTAIDLSWTAPADSGSSAVVGYRIERSTNDTTGWSDLVANTNSTGTTYKHTGLASASTWYYRVSAINSVGLGTSSNVANATTKARPGAPTSLTAAADADTAIDLSWTAPADSGSSAVVGYRIEWSTNDTTGWSDLVANTNSTGTTYKHTGLASASTWYYRVSAINALGPGMSSNVANATTKAKPRAPTSLTAAADADTAIDLSWTEPADPGSSAVVGYRIEWSTNDTTGWSDLEANTGLTATTYKHTGLAPATTRYYRVYAINALGAGAPSNVAGATTGKRPGEPTSLMAAADGDSAIDLSWTAPTDSGTSAITGYQIEVSNNGVSGWASLVTLGYADDTNFRDKGLAPGSTRHYRVSAINDVGAGQPSNVDDATTDAAPGMPPGVPSSLTATEDGDSAIDLSWTAPADSGTSAITGYRIEWSSNGTTGWADVQTNTGSTATSYKDIGLGSGVTRYYQVSAINRTGTGAPSDVAHATTKARPSPPTGLEATAVGDSAIALSWTAPADSGSSAINAYQIEASNDGNSGWRVLQGNTGSTTTTFRDGDVTPGSTLYYRVSAINNLGPGLPSNVDHATTGTRSLAPGNLTATADADTAIDLAWNVPTNTGSSPITGYRIQVSTDGGSAWSDLEANTGSTANTYKHTGLPPGTTRHYQGVGNQRRGHEPAVECRPCHNPGHRGDAARGAEEPHGDGGRGFGDRSVVDGADGLWEQRDHRVPDRMVERRQPAMVHPGRQQQLDHD